jgi:hypothetical protein
VPISLLISPLISCVCRPLVGMAPGRISLNCPHFSSGLTSPPPQKIARQAQYMSVLPSESQPRRCRRFRGTFSPGLRPRQRVSRLVRLHLPQLMVRIKPLIVFSIRLFFLMLALGAVGVLVIWLTIAPSLPSVESLRDVRLQVPLRVYSADQQLMAEIGEQRRMPVTLDQMPDQLKLAFLAAEDDRFYSHPGIDWRGTARVSGYMGAPWDAAGFPVAAPSPSRWPAAFFCRPTTRSRASCARSCWRSRSSAS